MYVGGHKKVVDSPGITRTLLWGRSPPWDRVINHPTHPISFQSPSPRIILIFKMIYSLCLDRLIELFCSLACINFRFRSPAMVLALVYEVIHFEIKMPRRYALIRIYHIHIKNETILFFFHFYSFPKS